MYTASLQSLVDELGRLPGIGPKSAQRLAFHILKVAPEDAARLAEAIVAVKEHTTLCPQCFDVAEGDLCTICRDPRRDGAILCVVEDPATSAPSSGHRSSKSAITSSTGRSIPSRASDPTSCTSVAFRPRSTRRG